MTHKKSARLILLFLLLMLGFSVLTKSQRTSAVTKSDPCQTCNHVCLNIYNYCVNHATTQAQLDQCYTNFENCDIDCTPYCQ